MAAVAVVQDEAYYRALEERLGPGRPFDGAYEALALAVLVQAVELARGDPKATRLMGPKRWRIVVGWRRRARRFLRDRLWSGFWAEAAGVRPEAFHQVVRGLVS